MDSKKQVELCYQELIMILGSLSDNIKSIDGVNRQFNRIQNTVAGVLDNKIAEVKAECQAAINETVWDNLVIAFFGTTNAGKSTIIETFRILFDDMRKKEDGLIVGDGQSDFTKTYDEYQLEIDGIPFTLIDVPGIEGNEDDFRDVIKTALHKAHFVFYVQGENKKPDSATAEKIKKYLGDWVKVYSIYNVRGGVTNYDEEEERETLLTEGVIKAERLIKETFKGILGEVYAGHITLQAFLAMCAKASFSPKREDLIRNQRKLLKLFGGNAEEILAFSQFSTLVSLVRERSSNFSTEILEANKQKLMALARRVELDISSTIDGQQTSINELEEKLRLFNSEICKNGFAHVIKQIQNRTRYEIEREYSRLRTELYNKIDQNVDSDVIKKFAREIQVLMRKELSCRIHSLIRDEIKSLVGKAERKRKDLDGIQLPNIRIDSYINVDTNIDFDGAIENIEIDLADVFEWTGKTAGTAVLGAGIGSVIPVVGTVAGAIAGAIIGGIVHAASGDGGKAEAKKEIGRVIGLAKDKAVRKCELKLSGLLRKLHENRRLLQSAVNEELDNLDEFSDQVHSASLQLKSYISNLKHS